MPKYVHPDVMDNGLVIIRDNANQLLVITAYAQGDNFATVQSRAVCTIPVTSADLVLGTEGIMNRAITVASRTGTASGNSPAAPDLHFALVDTATSRVLAVGDEASNQQIINGNPIVTPVWRVISAQPV